MHIFILTKRIRDTVNLISAHPTEEEAWINAGMHIGSTLKELGLDSSLAEVVAKSMKNLSKGNEEYIVEKIPYQKAEDPVDVLFRYVCAKNIEPDLIDKRINEIYDNYQDNVPIKTHVRILLALCDGNFEQAQRILEFLEKRGKQWLQDHKRLPSAKQ